MAPLPWCPLPRALLTSPRARMLSLDAVGALFVAWSLSGDDSVVAPPRDCTAVEALVFVVAQHARESGDFDREARTRAAERQARIEYERALNQQEINHENTLAEHAKQARTARQTKTTRDRPSPPEDSEPPPF